MCARVRLRSETTYCSRPGMTRLGLGKSLLERLAMYELMTWAGSSEVSGAWRYHWSSLGISAMKWLYY